MTPADIKTARRFWNANVQNSELPYRKLSLSEFTDKFVTPWPGIEKYNSLSWDGDGNLIGFANAVFVPAKRTGYITMILVDPAHRNQGIGTELYHQLEWVLKNPNRRQFSTSGSSEEANDTSSCENLDIIFFNPINLEWIVPDTVTHDHPNSPGVEFPSPAYNFFKNKGFADLALQNSYYRPLTPPVTR